MNDLRPDGGSTRGVGPGHPRYGGRARPGWSGRMRPATDSTNQNARPPTLSRYLIESSMPLNRSIDSLRSIAATLGVGRQRGSRCGSLRIVKAPANAAPISGRMTWRNGSIHGTAFRGVPWAAPAATTKVRSISEGIMQAGGSGVGTVSARFDGRDERMSELAHCRKRRPQMAALKSRNKPPARPGNRAAAVDPRGNMRLWGLRYRTIHIGYFRSETCSTNWRSNTAAKSALAQECDSAASHIPGMPV